MALFANLLLIDDYSSENEFSANEDTFMFYLEAFDKHYPNENLILVVPCAFDCLLCS